MPRRVNLHLLRKNAVKEVDAAMRQYKKAIKDALHYHTLWYIGAKVAIDLHAAWERFAEERLIAALNHAPATFIHNNEINGVRHIPVGLAAVLVRGGSRYFDFRGTDDLIKRADGLLGKSSNPFRKITKDDRKYLDTLSGIRNCIVHNSKLAFSTYKRMIRTTHGIKAAADPEEFLSAIDRRRDSPARNQSRLQGFIVVLKRTIRRT